MGLISNIAPRRDSHRLLTAFSTSRDVFTDDSWVDRAESSGFQVLNHRQWKSDERNWRINGGGIEKIEKVGE